MTNQYSPEEVRLMLTSSRVSLTTFPSFRYTARVGSGFVVLLDMLTPSATEYHLGLLKVGHHAAHYCPRADTDDRQNVSFNLLHKAHDSTQSPSTARNCSSQKRSRPKEKVSTS